MTFSTLLEFTIGARLRQDFTITANVLERTLDSPEKPKPYTIWTDNGKEYLREFTQLLEKRGIKSHISHKKRRVGS
jgi:transposase InsO family protein